MSPSQTWLITGCSSGFGEQFVHSLLARGDKVIATGRHAEKRLQHLQSTGAMIVDLDVTGSESVIRDTIDDVLRKEGGDIDVLVNNAGYIGSGPVEEMSHEKLLENLNTNLFGAVNVSRAVLPHFRARRSGTIVFMGSQAGWKGDPGAASYCASKFALEGIVECLQQELPQFGIRSIIFEPGFYRTKALSPQNLKHHQDTPTLLAYEQFNKLSREFEAAAYGNEPGDVQKAVERMIDVVKGEGMAAGKPMPNRLPLGSDGLKAVRDKCEATLKLCEEWHDLIVSTDISSPGS